MTQDAVVGLQGARVTLNDGTQESRLTILLQKERLIGLSPAELEELNHLTQRKGPIQEAVIR